MNLPEGVVRFRQRVAGRDPGSPVTDVDEAVGFALFFHNFSTFVGRPGIYLEDLYVRPEARGRGIVSVM